MAKIVSKGGSVKMRLTSSGVSIIFPTISNWVAIGGIVSGNWVANLRFFDQGFYNILECLPSSASVLAGNFNKV